MGFHQGADLDNCRLLRHCEKFELLQLDWYVHNKDSKPAHRFVALCPHGSTIYGSDRNESDREIQEKLS